MRIRPMALNIPRSKTKEPPIDAEETDCIVNRVDTILGLAGLDDECRARVTDLIVAGIKRANEHG